MSEISFIIVGMHGFVGFCVTWVLKSIQTAKDRYLIIAATYILTGLGRGDLDCCRLNETSIASVLLIVCFVFSWVGR